MYEKRTSSFPYLERHGVVEPPAIMWMEHDDIRAIEKNLYGLIDTHKSRTFKISRNN